MFAWFLFNGRMHIADEPPRRYGMDEYVRRFIKIPLCNDDEILQ